MKQSKRILFVTPYPFDVAPSQRFRFEQFFQALTEAGWQYVQKPFWNRYGWTILYAKGKYLQKGFFLLLGIIKRYFLLFSVCRYHYVFVHREFSPIGFPLTLWIITKLFKKKIIYDFDDAIWIPNVSDNNRWFRFLKTNDNTEWLIRWSYRVSCGNHYLKNYASQYNQHIYYIPTTLDMEHHHNRERALNKNEFILGWTGTHSTIRYLQFLIPIIQKIEKKYTHFRFYVISDQPVNWSLESLIYIPWSKSTEIDDLLKFSIGVMPLEHDPWSEGKCGFKALQYLSLGIPALVSPVGVNTHIIQQGVNGFLCQTPDEWEQCIEQLINNVDLLEQISRNTRKSMELEFSTQAVKPNFLSLFS
ncbi:MAG: glycosyltransferase [Flavobacteriales bacterium]|nr:glycosyltransferase [Flavobacteriales bacterium]